MLKVWVLMMVIESPLITEEAIGFTFETEGRYSTMEECVSAGDRVMADDEADQYHGWMCKEKKEEGYEV